MGKLIVHHLGVSQSDRVVWLCEELGIDYEMKKYDRAPLLSPPDYCKLHPLCAAPVIQDGDLTLAECELTFSTDISLNTDSFQAAACVEYIVNTYGNGKFIIKPGQPNYTDYLYWFRKSAMTLLSTTILTREDFANGTMQPMLGRNMALVFSGADPNSENSKRANAKRDQILSFLDKRLSQATWLAGDEFSAADIMNVFGLTVMRCFYQYDLGPYPNILAYLKRVSQRDGYQRAVQKGDPDLDVEKLIGGSPPPPQKAVAARLAGKI
jgi:glutathione S-transferase